MVYFAILKNKDKKKMYQKKTKISNIALLCMSATLAIVFLSCDSCSNNRKNDILVAKIGDKRLYVSDLNGFFPRDCSIEDSLRLSKLYIDNWIKTQLLLQKAELNLPPEDLDISEEMETYRASLLIHKYKNLMLLEKLDTAVRLSEINRYYEDNIANFSAEEYCVRAIFIKLPLESPELWNVRRWYTSTREADVQKLTDYCRKYAVEFDLYDDKWLLWANIEVTLPNQEAASRQMKQWDRVEQYDEKYIYFVHIREKRAPGEPAPLDFVKDRVKSIIINKRKLKFINELEQNIYSEGLEKKRFEIFKINDN